MKESDAQVKFGKWIRDNNYDKTSAFELKLCHNNKALAFSAFESQQLPCLLQAKTGFLFKKLSDADRSLKPFDCFVIAHCEAYVIACWHHDGKAPIAYWLEIETFLNAQKITKRKSITEAECATLASKVITL